MQCGPIVGIQQEDPLLLVVMLDNESACFPESEETISVSLKIWAGLHLIQCWVLEV